MDLKSNIASRMALVQASIESDYNPLHIEDPFDWTVDQVVHCLCSPDSLILQSSGGLSMPDGFADALQEQQINGKALLTVLDLGVLRDELGVKALGVRAKILDIIERLQQQSSKYQGKMERKIISESRVPSVAQMSRYSTPYMRSPEHSGMVGQNLSLGLNYDYPRARNLLEQGPLLPPTGVADLRGITDVSAVPRLEPIAEAEVLLATQPREEPNEKNAPRVKATTETQPPSTISTTHRQFETTFVDDEGRHRRRLVLNPVSVIDTSLPASMTASAGGDLTETVNPRSHHLGYPSAPNADGVENLHAVKNGLPDHLSFKEPLGSDTTSRTMSHYPTDEDTHPDGRPRKRLKPTLISEPTNNSVSEEVAQKELIPTELSPATEFPKAILLPNESDLGKTAKRETDHVYLGPSALQIDNIFFGDTALGQSIPDNAQDAATEVSFNSSKQFGNAQRLYINSRLKYFLRSSSSTLDLVKTGEPEISIVPYPDRFGKKHQPNSMTLLAKTPAGITASRVIRSRRNAYASQPRTDISNDQWPSDVFEIAGLALAVDSDDGNWDALEKWKYVDNDQVLPLYGDSGSEGEYDLETWREMEAESGKIARPEGRSKTKKLSPVEVKEAIETAIKQISHEWHLKQLPRVQPKAWRFWAKSRRDRTVHAQTNDLVQQDEILSTRIHSLKKEISDEEWSKSSEIIKQSKCLQPSIFDREECRWRLDILRSKKAPQKVFSSTAPKPHPRRIKTSTEPYQNGDDILDSAASSAEDASSDDGLNDFIVDDEHDGNEAHITLDDEELTMADVEDAVESDTLIIPSSRVLAEKKEEGILPQMSLKTKMQTGSVRPMSPNVIDLTQASDPPAPSSPSLLLKRESPRIVTPPVINSTEDSDAWFQRSRGKKAIFKNPPSANTISIINLDTDSDRQAIAETLTLPPFNHVGRIRALSPTELVERQDRKRLLVWLIAHTRQEKRQQTSVYVSSTGMDTCFHHVKRGLEDMKADRRRLASMDNTTSESVLQVAAWYIGWTIPVKCDQQGVNVTHINITLMEDEGFESFYEFMLECLRHYKEPSQTMNTPSKKQVLKRTQCKNYDLSDSSELDPRIFASESQEAIQKRDTALQRMRENKQRVEKRARQLQLQSRFAAMTSKAENPSDVILNPGKLDEVDYIRLNPSFGRGAQLKSHQEEGLQFMWREIMGDHDDLQGCLLAQTMGLGKTIQVIALLVAISDAAQSLNLSVRNQVPIELRRSQTLVLCPPALIENWWDEFLMWPPDNHHLGDVRKISSVMKLDDRISEIRAWSLNGGVLLMGYHTFRDLIQNKPRALRSNKAAATTGISPLNDGQYRIIRAALLEKPNIVVADEAHEFKSQTSSINQVINQIKCKSRIALTGSPLSNNLGEYFSMIDWIASGYLGSYDDFKDVYEVPIQTGLYQDREPALYRQSRKRLKALELELEPKVHRADLTALHESLNGKSEFVIRLPLTTFQEKLYASFVYTMRDITGDTNRKLRNSKLWAYLAVLQLLCNHPKSFHDKLQRAQDDPKHDVRGSPASGKAKNHATSGPSLSNSDEDLQEDEPLPNAMLSQAYNATKQAFEELGEASDALHLSNKMQAVMRIIALSEAAGDKVLVFSHRLDTLDYVGKQLGKGMTSFDRIDGLTAVQKRQDITKSFNEGSTSVCLISTRAGGQGLNLFGANRVVILDNHFNPMWEQQAVGRAYRIGQKKHVFVYRLTVAGTFEEEIQDQALFKEQLATRVLEKKNPERIGQSGTKQYFFLPKPVENSDLDDFRAKDNLVLDHLLAEQETTPIVSITRSETFYLDDGYDLTVEEREEAEQMLKDEQLRRRDPVRYTALMQQRYAQQSRHPSSFSASIPGQPPPAERNLKPVAAPTAPMTDISTLDTIPYAPVVPKRAPNVAPDVKSVEARLVHSIANLFHSEHAATDRKRIPKAVRIEAKSTIRNLISQKQHPLPQIRETTRKLRSMIDEHAKDEEDYRRLLGGIRVLLETEDVHPNTLFRVMVESLGQLGGPWLNAPSQETDSVSTEAATPTKDKDIPKTTTPKPITMANTSPYFSGSTSIPHSAATALGQNPVGLLDRTDNKKRPHLAATKNEPSAKKQKSSVIETPKYSVTGPMRAQFEALMESDKQRK